MLTNKFVYFLLKKLVLNFACLFLTKMATINDQYVMELLEEAMELLKESKNQMACRKRTLFLSKLAVCFIDPPGEI